MSRVITDRDDRLRHAPGIREGGGDRLPFGAVSDGHYLKRVGNEVVGAAAGGGGSTPTGTGFVHVTAGVQDAAAKLVQNADVHASAAIAESKLSLNYPTHATTNDPNAGEKAALVGTSGTPGSGNKYVTDGDARNTNARTPTAHAASHVTGGTDILATFGAAAVGLVPASGGGTTNFLRADGTWAAPAGGSTPTGTGFRHVSAGAEDAAATYTATDQLTIAPGTAKAPLSLGVNGREWVEHLNADKVDGYHAQSSPYYSVIPVSNGSGKLDGWISDAGASTKGLVQLAGQLGGTAASPDVRGLRETAGPTLLTLGAIADGETLVRSGATIVGSAGGGGGLSHQQVMSRIFLAA